MTGAAISERNQTSALLTNAPARIRVRGLAKKFGSLEVFNNVDFDVGFFSTPMIDNTRLSNDQRVALVLTDMNQYGATLSLVYFPGSRASLREKPYYEEILRKLTDTSTVPR